MTSIKTNHVKIESKSGVTLSGYLMGLWDVIENSSKANLIIIFHGIMDSGEFRLIKHQAQKYAKAGYLVLSFDFYGHGLSGGKVIDMTISKELLDAQSIMQYALSIPNVEDIYLVGHSQGAIIASITAPKYNEIIKKLVLLAPAGFIPEMVRQGYFFDVQLDPSNPPEKVPVFDSFLGRQYLIDAQSIDVYGESKGYTNHDILIVSAGNDMKLVNESSVNEYEKIYTDAGNRVITSSIEGAPHDFLEYYDLLCSVVLNFL